jgi:hypoxanthine-guanine phosphoribosyltransferase
MDFDEAVIKALEISKENEMVFPKGKRGWTNDEAIINILQQCNSQDDIDLVDELFHQFNDNIVDESQNYDLLCEMAETIIKKEIQGQNTALCVMRTKNDKDADSSQSVINELKVAFATSGGFDKGYSAVCFEDIESLYNKGYRHFIVVDDFIGSGKTVKARYQYFKNRHMDGATISFYFIAGMAKAISFCKNNKIPVHCCKIMNKGISGHYHYDQLLKRVRSMKRLESLLGKESGPLKLKDHLFGYGQAEALYCRQYGNVPNSVFPLFWWKRNLDGSKRKPVFTRVQYGY